MKKLILLAIFAVAIISCRKVKQQEALLVKDCTGAYLRINDKDYKICNRSVAEHYQNGTLITVSFKHMGACNENYIECEMLHEFEDWIKVTDIETQ